MFLAILNLCAVVWLALLHSVSADVAYINIIRHGEKCADSGDDLTATGYARADYLARCMSADAQSAAMPFGKATAVMAGEGKHSKRPKETATPLAKKLGVTLNMPCSKTDSDCFAENAMKHLVDKGTLVVAWAHESIPPLLKALGLKASSQYKDWPDACPSKTFSEPSCTFPEGSTCYDAIWQIKMERSSSDSSWKPQSIESLAEGFGGSSSSPCAQDLAPGNVREAIVVV